MVEHSPLALVLMRSIEGNVLFFDRCKPFQVVHEVEMVLVKVG